VLRAIENETGEELPTVTGSRRPGDPAVLVADPARAREAFRFDARRSSLGTIVRTAWNWHRGAHPRMLSDASEQRCTAGLRRAGFSLLEASELEADDADRDPAARLRPSR
jgi:hypothetical protein